MSGRMGATSWGAYVWLPAVRHALTAAAVDIAQARAAVRPVIVHVPSVHFELNAEPDTTRGTPATAPNVVAVHGERAPAAASTGRSTAAAGSDDVLARVIRLVLYLGADLANTPSRLDWSAEGRRRLRQAIDGE